jgi:Cu/Ag efflux pump CusA
MTEFIHKLRQKSEQEKQKIALAVSLTITLVIIVLWFTLNSFAKDEVSTTTSSPLEDLGEDLNTIIANPPSF